jgi:hypothetical protein
MEFVVFFLFVAACLWWGAIASMRARSRRQQATHVHQAVMCGQCRYPREGLAGSAVCPECGADPASVPPLASAPPRASWRLAWIPIMTMVACAGAAGFVGNALYFIFVLMGAAGMMLPASVVALIMGARRKATTKVLLGHLCAAAIFTIGLSVIVSIDLSKIRSATGLEALAVPSMAGFALLGVPLLTCLWEGAVLIWSLRRPKP